MSRVFQRNFVLIVIQLLKSYLVNRFPNDILEALLSFILLTKSVLL